MCVINLKGRTSLLSLRSLEAFQDLLSKSWNSLASHSLLSILYISWPLGRTVRMRPIVIDAVQTQSSTTIPCLPPIVFSLCRPSRGGRSTGRTVNVSFTTFFLPLIDYKLLVFTPQALKSLHTLCMSSCS